MSTSARSRARELALQALYALEMGINGSDQLLEDLSAEAPLDDGALEYARGLVAKTREKAEVTDARISELADNWKLERIALIDHLILRMAMTELSEMVDVPVKVVLNEAIELAKKYSTASSSGFVNGLLDAFVKNSPDRFRV
jgi:N utilization substance protein B